MEKKKKVNKTEIERGHYKEYCSQNCRNLSRGGVNYGRRGGGTWEKTRQRVLERDNNICKLCNNNNSTNIHHIIPYRDFDSKYEANKDSNLISLCEECHKLTYCNEYEFIGLFKRIMEGELNGENSHTVGE